MRSPPSSIRRLRMVVTRRHSKCQNRGERRIQKSTAAAWGFDSLGWSEEGKEENRSCHLTVGNIG